MGNILNSGNSATSNSFDYGYSQQVSGCCDSVVDPISLLTVIGGIAGLSLWLRQAVIDFNIMGGRKKRFLDIIWIGKEPRITLSMLPKENQLRIA